ncbi:ergothioneine biosynthesis protein EgtB [Hansschlegelia plantiphila]|uniref:Ergothioneine biosynthesis protein EgtB n=1 Tax=Hansschlegelia plantiphila TaxID=374655 RepID=A0A9W6J4W3_9HYPH|nr:ergothioneine biosynthesis protein EgtB [Hansschlegelia plantiphila]GLK69409.1 ergothioneine biosynthesis protein EgtB [Hansschlegelia plantiphila]
MTGNPVRLARQSSTLSQRYSSVRGHSRKLAGPLSDADATAQSMADASPAKWHLAHTTWFFETMVLKPNAPGYRVFDETFNFLFNSYYETIGARHPRPKRGLLTRPSLDAILAFRAHVDVAMEALIADGPDRALADLIELGCHHEQQHQELLLTDILHLFAQSPVRPAYRDPEPVAVADDPGDADYVAFEGGLIEIGHDGAGFAFDCEGPRHKTYVRPFRIADRLVTNREWMAFMTDGGYRDPLLWLADGWGQILEHRWTAPLYWEDRDGAWWSMTLRGMQPVDPSAPVTHVSYFEADAFASWAGKRLPTEAEWELASADVPVDGTFAGGGRLRPRPAGPPTGGPRQMFGDVWEWTRSPFTPYPGFKIAEGAVGEYNGKFMCGQFVLRGGSCATPDDHVRATYRNFFQPDKRWQFSGLRLAEDA